MILDAFQQFSNAQSITGTVQTFTSTNELDYGILSGIPSSAAGGGARDMSVGDSPSLKLLVQVAQTVTSGGAATLQVVMQGAPDNGSGAAGAYVTWWSSPVYALASLVAGARLYDMDFPRPPQGVVIPRFVRLQYILAGATSTAGAITAYVLIDRDDQMYNSTNNAIQGGYPPGLIVAN